VADPSPLLTPHFMLRPSLPTSPLTCCFTTLPVPLQDGVTEVADPSQCRHISPTALAYAAAMSSFLRSADNQLPVWDKRFGR
jgi:hypothetical protein